MNAVATLQDVVRFAGPTKAVVDGRAGVGDCLMELSTNDHSLPRTAALRRALKAVQDDRAAEDLLFLEAWEAHPLPGAGLMLRVGQLRRANPGLAAEIRAELRRGRPLTADERAALKPPENQPPPRYAI